MRTSLVITGIFSLLLLASCGKQVAIYTDSVQEARWDEYKTYQFLDFTEGNQKTITGMELERIRVAFANEIEKRGFRYDADNPDVSIQITVYHREAANGYYYRPYAYRYMERALSVDMYDNLTRQHVWHGAAVGELEQDPQLRAEELPSLASRIFDNYPIKAGQEI
jgi:hypothetical protein